MPNSVKSACQALIYRTYLETWKRGEKYASEGKVNLTQYSDTNALATVYGTKSYLAYLEFRGNGLSRKCSCPVKDFCKHITALAIVWDGLRGIPKSSAREVENQTVPPPLVTYAQVQAVYDDPLNADLDVLRIASDELGNWSRPHARLPNSPKFITNPKVVLELEEVKKALYEISSWERRRNYDMYFCAGEMVAAFCEILRAIKVRVPVSDAQKLKKILALVKNFNERLIMELIDDSDGHWQIINAHLGNLEEFIKQND